MKHEKKKIDKKKKRKEKEKLNKERIRKKRKVTYLNVVDSLASEEQRPRKAARARPPRGGYGLRGKKDIFLHGTHVSDLLNVTKQTELRRNGTRV